MELTNKEKEMIMFVLDLATKDPESYDKFTYDNNHTENFEALQTGTIKLGKMLYYI